VLAHVLAHAATTAPQVLAVDSIQTVVDPDQPGAPGSVTQVRDGAYRLVQHAKEHGRATVLVGHVTKEGTLAGPRVLEHVVDTVLSFEGDRHHALRMLRALKHRFGSTHELGLATDPGRQLARVRQLEAAALAARAQHLPGEHPPDIALEFQLHGHRVLEAAGGKLPRSLGDDHAARLGRGLQPGRQVRRLADRRDLVRRADAEAVADDDQSGRDADVNRRAAIGLLRQQRQVMLRAASHSKPWLIAPL